MGPDFRLGTHDGMELDSALRVLTLRARFSSLGSVDFP
jgi:hypothetical protein